MKITVVLVETIEEFHAYVNDLYKHSFYRRSFNGNQITFSVNGQEMIKFVKVSKKGGKLPLA